jgi:hypothetical protein
MRRWLSILLLGHVLGSYGIEACDAIDNYELEVPIRERLIAPVRDLPWLVRATLKTRPSQLARFQLVQFWIAYAFGFSVVVATSIVMRRQRSKRLSHGFDVIDSDESHC